MKVTGLVLVLILGSPCLAQDRPELRRQAEYYAAVYAKHYGLPLDFVRAVIEQESGWHPCAVSIKGAVGLMQLMPGTAARLGTAGTAVWPRCTAGSGGVCRGRRMW